MRSFLEDLTPTLTKSKVLISYLLDELEIVYGKNANVTELPKVVDTTNEIEDSVPEISTIVNVKTENNQEFIVPEESNDVATNVNLEEDFTLEDQVEIKEDPLEREINDEEITDQEIDRVQINADLDDSNQQVRISKSRKRKNKDANSVPNSNQETNNIEDNTITNLDFHDSTKRIKSSQKSVVVVHLGEKEKSKGNFNYYKSM